jgi:hypothetical protein
LTREARQTHPFSFLLRQRTGAAPCEFHEGDV